MGALNQRQGLLISAIVHVVILSMLSARPEKREPPVPVAQAEARAERVFMPPPEVLRQLAPRPPAQARPAAPRPPEPPPDPKAKSKISIGAPSTERAKELILRREDDLTAQPKGRPDARPSPPPEPAQPAVAANAQAGTPSPQPSSAPGLRLPPGIGTLPTGKEAPPPGPKGSGPAIASSLQRLDQRLAQLGPQGLESGTGKQMGPLFFDPEGADFTVWINQFKNEVYRNWIVPQAAALGFRGHVDIEFTVERDGTMTGIRMLKSSGTVSLDRAAENALRGSRLLPLPRDYGPPQVTMQVTFFYNEGPRES